MSNTEVNLTTNSNQESRSDPVPSSAPLSDSHAITNSSPNQNSASVSRVNVLLLDGGGVRGLSALLILRKLMQYVNQYAKELGYDGPSVQPHQVFKLVAGTSTGGLISIMLGKLGMSVDECIQEYRELSSEIFGKKKFRGQLTRGLVTSKYSGKKLLKCVRGLIHRKGKQMDLHMLQTEPQQDGMACAVVCREHESRHKYSPMTRTAVCVCSLPCHDGLSCNVCEAARATSAAPTFFKLQAIKDGEKERYLADGGFEYNNPSYVIYYHYYSQGLEERRQSNRDNINNNGRFTAHQNIDLSLTRFVNIGTGDQEADTPERKRDRLAVKLLPAAILFGEQLKHTLQKCATEAHKTAKFMKTLEATADNRLQYVRFSASTGVCWMELDRHSALPEIEELTNEFLQFESVEDKMMQTAKAIARDVWGS